MANSTERNEHLKKLREMIKDIEYGMLTTLDETGKLHSRPMSTNGHVEFDGDLWFFTYASSHKVVEVEQNHQVNVSFSAPNKQQYVSMSGTAQLVRDRNKLEQLWQPQLTAWFPKGLEEPDLGLLKVSVETAEYWDSPSSPVAHAVSLISALTTGKPQDPSQHERLNLTSVAD
ncbi:pyridoxamine 5'-phosphate oxidase family protein [Leptolyngbya sp. FACHB-261]|uniref:pyridoxamine 5'-phosphate oxidase family protein n=1 Tax=Leptolyngbya sp. FACHB-261 TaxID=2692806 RepID=UPI0016854396|nr:pyridoxamine 5'-phosphate oxidase family protein [Leptolyngbya sp. FACHB-261]MBD2104980.1 pyridoxamine 5'-phosphate oxidase family protein [Leptolyngbya sp. FACHB-261]